MRVLISGGGTGGHVYPALAVAAQLPRVLADHVTHVTVNAKAGAELPPGQPDSNSTHSHLFWIGTTGRMEQGLVERAGVAFGGIYTGQLRGMNPLAALANMARMAQGIRQSQQILDKFRPDVCFVTGGYVCAPVVVACRLRHIPVLIYLPDIVPGWAIRMLSKLAQCVAVTMPAAASYFGGEAPQGKAVVTGYPVRQELLTVTGCGRLEATAHLRNRTNVRKKLAMELERPLASVEPNGQTLPLVLVSGGSQGSRSINRAIWAALAEVLQHAHLLHIVGERDWSLYQQEAPAKGLAPDLARRYHPTPYLHDTMALALAAADVAVARAGASSLGELPIARLSSVLVPLLGVNQQQNAEQLAQRGATVVVDDDKLASQLAPSLLDLIHDEPRRRRMEAALAELAQPEAALNIGRQLVRLSQGRF